MRLKLFVRTRREREDDDKLAALKISTKTEKKTLFPSIRSRLKLVTLPDSLRCHHIARTLQHCISSVTAVSTPFHGEHWEVCKLSWAHFRWWCAAVVKVVLLRVSSHHVNFEIFQCQETIQVRRQKLCNFSISLAPFVLSHHHNFGEKGNLKVLQKNGERRRHEIPSFESCSGSGNNGRGEKESLFIFQHN